MKFKKVKVRAMRNNSGEIEFDIDGVNAKQSRIHLPKNSGAHKITFELKDHTGRGLGFDRRDPMWVGEDCPCPPPEGLHSNQLRVTDCGAEKLTVVNENCGRERELRYQLNFTTADGAGASCDPVITNGGGTQS